ncbi:decorin-like, partial [Stegodyphus dumicola]|uniref:decorin-like n=1 Tax=Stegodyphus dumicola TaxID=202533 RepID=UPI0015A91881
MAMRSSSMNLCEKEETGTYSLSCPRPKLAKHDGLFSRSNGTHIVGETRHIDIIILVVVRRSSSKADKNKDQYFNSLFRKRPDEDREKMKIKDCKLLHTVSSCQCSWKSLFCENRGFKAIPLNLPFDVKELDLSGNFLPEISHFNFTDLRFLQSLICNNAGVAELGEMVFYKFTALTFLYLSYNPIQVIEEGAFIGLDSLEE